MPSAAIRSVVTRHLLHISRLDIRPGSYHYTSRMVEPNTSEAALAVKGEEAMIKVQAPQGAAANTTWQDTPTQTINVGGVEFAYRQLGPDTGVPVVFLTHLAAVLDNWDPRVVDGIAAKHPVITFDNRGVGASTGSTPATIEEMARDAVTFIRAL